MCLGGLANSDSGREHGLSVKDSFLTFHQYIHNEAY